MFLPILFNTNDHPFIIIGGGKVALRKAKKLLEFGAQVSCVSKEFEQEFIALEGIHKVIDSYNDSYLQKDGLVIAATSDNQLNQKIKQDCRRLGKLCCIVDDREGSDFIFPATHKQGDLVIAVSTGGKSPSLAKSITKVLKETYNEVYEEKVNLLGILREAIIALDIDELEKKELLSRIIYLDIEDLRKFVITIKENNYEGNRWY